MDAHRRQPVRERRYRMRQLLRRQGALAEFGGYAFRESSLQAILDMAARVCAECMDTSHSKVCRYRADRHDLLVVAGHGWHQGVVGHATSPANASSPQGRAYTKGNAVVIRDLRRETRHKLPAFYAEHGIVSTLDIIIESTDGPPFGVLEVDCTTLRAFSRIDIDFLKGFANILAEAVATAESVERMKVLVTEKDVLLVELKHRVRNNLQLIEGLLDSHSRRLGSTAEERDSIAGISRRVMTLAAAFDHLLGDNLANQVEFADYLRSLCAMLSEPHTGNTASIACDAEPLLVGLDTATTVGMAVAELVSNSFQHARPGRRLDADPSEHPNGDPCPALAVAVTLRRQGMEAVLRVADNGAGFVEQPGSKRRGVGLVRRLLEQAKGRAEAQSANGTAWTLRFPVPDRARHASGTPA